MSHPGHTAQGAFCGAVLRGNTRAKLMHGRAWSLAMGINIGKHLIYIILLASVYTVRQEARLAIHAELILNDS